MFDWVTTMCCTVAVLTVSFLNQGDRFDYDRLILTGSCLSSNVLGYERDYFPVGHLPKSLASTPHFHLLWNALLLCDSFCLGSFFGRPWAQSDLYLNNRFAANIPFFPLLHSLELFMIPARLPQ